MSCEHFLNQFCNLIGNVMKKDNKKIDDTEKFN